MTLWMELTALIMAGGFGGSTIALAAICIDMRIENRRQRAYIDRLHDHIAARRIPGLRGHAVVADGNVYRFPDGGA